MKRFSNNELFRAFDDFYGSRSNKYMEFMYRGIRRLRFFKMIRSESNGFLLPSESKETLPGLLYLSTLNRKSNTSVSHKRKREIDKAKRIRDRQRKK